MEIGTPACYQGQRRMPRVVQGDAARVTLADTQRETARACPRHAVAALNGITGARVVWADTRGVNDHERAALIIAEERSQLARPVAP